MGLLSNLVVIDLTSRLPGPYAGYLLSQMGAKVIKIENSLHRDAFSDKDLHKLDPIFSTWYENLNNNKEYLELNFISDLARLQGYILGADIILVPNKEKVIDTIKLKELSLKKNLSIIKVGGHHQMNKSMHDLNAIAQIEAFHLHAITSDSPPFLPLAGISYGQKIATEAIALHLKTLRENKTCWHESFLDLSTQEQYAPFWSKELTHNTKHLHSGLFPCYNLYKLSDGGTLAVAAVEEKFWNLFIKTFNLPLTLDDRYDTSQRVFEIIKQNVASLTVEEAQTKIAGHDLCVTVVLP